jgi:RNA polymerase sigma-70 factor (ECF subfamily)
MDNQADVLIKELQQGSEKAFGLLYDQYSSSLYGLILKIVADDGLAQDLLQECFITVWKKASLYDPSKGSFFTWMLNICRNRSIDELRKVNRQRTHLDQIVATNEISPLGDATNVDAIGLNDIIDKLPKEQQVIIDYLYFRGYTQKETSEELNIPLGTVKTRARYALNELKNVFVIIVLIWILKNT